MTTTCFADLPEGKNYPNHPDMPGALQISVMFRNVDMFVLRKTRNDLIKMLIATGKYTVVLGGSYFTFRVFGSKDLGMLVTFDYGKLVLMQYRRSTSKVVYEDDPDAVYPDVLCFDTLPELFAEIKDKVK